MSYPPLQLPLRFVVIALTAGVPYPELAGPCGRTKWSQGCGLVVSLADDRPQDVRDDHRWLAEAPAALHISS